MGLAVCGVLLWAAGAAAMLQPQRAEANVQRALPPLLQTAVPPAGTRLPGGLPVLQPRQFSVTPQVGPPGTKVTVDGYGWEPYDPITLRLQNPVDLAAPQAEYLVAIADSGGSFRASFTMPAGPPWGDLPAILVWAASMRTGQLSTKPEPFVLVRGPLQPPVNLVPGLQVTPTPLPVRPAAPAVTPRPTASPVPTASAGVFPSPLSPTEEATPTPAGAGVFQSPLATPTKGALPLPPTVEVEVTVEAATPEAETPEGATPEAATPEAAAPNLLPRAGEAGLATARVNTPREPLLAGANRPDAVREVLDAGSELGVVGQSATGQWLLVITDDGTTGWIRRVATDFTQASPVVPGPE